MNFQKPYGQIQKFKPFEPSVQKQGPLFIISQVSGVLCDSVTPSVALETYNKCTQKRKREIGSSLTEADIELLLHSLYEGHCTLISAKERKNQYFRGLTDEYRRCFGSSTSVRKAHDPGQDAYKCGRLPCCTTSIGFSFRTSSGLRNRNSLIGL